MLPIVKSPEALFKRIQAVEVKMNFSVNILDTLLANMIYGDPAHQKHVAIAFRELDMLIDSNFSDVEVDVLYKACTNVRKAITKGVTDEEALRNATYEDSENEDVIDQSLHNIDSVFFDDNDHFTPQNHINIYEYLKQRSSYATLFQATDVIDEIAEALTTQTFDEGLESFAQYTKEIFSWLTKKIDVSGDSTDSQFDHIIGTNDQSEAQRTNTIFGTAIAEMNNPANHIKTGIQLHNKQLGVAAAWTAGRLYTYIAKSGGGKSLFLMLALRWANKFNKSQDYSEERLRPCALLVSMENSVTETAERSYDLLLDEDHVLNHPFREQTEDHVAQAFEEHGYNDDNSFAVAIRYRRNKSITTSDLEPMIDDLAEKGYEVKLICLDYLKRIRPTEPTGELRLDLGNSTDELATLAKTRNIVVITCMQMNGHGIETLENVMDKGGVNALSEINSGVIGESKLIIENTDFLFVINSEKGVNGTNYLGIKRLKSRGKEDPNAAPIIYQPYCNNMLSGHIVEDVELPDKECMGVTNPADLLGGASSSTSKRKRDPIKPKLINKRRAEEEETEA